MNELEAPARIEPLLFEDEVPRVLVDLVAELYSEVRDLGSGLHPSSGEELADLVRVMNCYRERTLPAKSDF